MVIKLLVYIKYKILNITIKEAKRHKFPDQVLDFHESCNYADKETPSEHQLEKWITETSTWNHGISWDGKFTLANKVIVGGSIPFLAKTEAELGTSIAFGFGGTHGWGKSLERRKKTSVKVTLNVPPGKK